MSRITTSEMKNQKTVVHRVSETIIDNIRYAVRDVMTRDLLHVEQTLVFGQIRYIFNINTMWELPSSVLWLKFPCLSCRR